jgi:hypothetical protein
MQICANDPAFEKLTFFTYLFLLLFNCISFQFTNLKKMTDSTNNTSLAKSALIAGIAIFIMVIAAPFSELYVYPKLVISDNAAQTAANIIANKALFIYGIFGYLVTFICDIFAAWALYVLLKPVNKNFSLLTALFRLVYTVIALAALLNLLIVLKLLSDADYLKVFTQDQLFAEVMIFLSAFKSGWNFGIIFFGIHLVLLGYLVFRAPYIPWIIGILLVITGLGYLITALNPYLFPDTNLHIARYTFYGELIFMLWLLIKGSRIKQA